MSAELKWVQKLLAKLSSKVHFADKIYFVMMAISPAFQTRLITDLPLALNKGVLPGLVIFRLYQLFLDYILTYSKSRAVSCAILSAL